MVFLTGNAKTVIVKNLKSQTTLQTKRKIVSMKRDPGKNTQYKYYESMTMKRMTTKENETYDQVPRANRNGKYHPQRS
jgi:hypothetical protein